jgi:putative transposase
MRSPYVPIPEEVRPVPEVLAPVPDAILNQFAPGKLTAADVEAATRRFKKALPERAMGAELWHHLAQRVAAETPANHRNGSGAKTVLTDDGALPLVIPRDRHGTFAPVLIPKHPRRLTGFDDKILALCTRGLTVVTSARFCKKCRPSTSRRISSAR